MNTKDSQVEIAQGAPLAASGVLGADFWDEVQRLVEGMIARQQPPADKVAPRPGIADR